MIYRTALYCGFWWFIWQHCIVDFGTPLSDWVPSQRGEWTTCFGDSYRSLLYCQFWHSSVCDWVPSQCGEWTTCCGDDYGTVMCGWCGHLSVYKIARCSKSKGVFRCCLSVCADARMFLFCVLLICSSLLFQMDDKDSVKESFLARLQDENLAVVKALLKDPQVMSAVFRSFYYSDLVSDVRFGEKRFWFVC